MKTMIPTIVGGVIAILGFITAAFGVVCLAIKFLTTSTDPTLFVNKYAGLFWAMVGGGALATFAGAAIFIFV